MSIFSTFDERLPRAFNGCGCHCHKMPNVYHCVPCCYPTKADFEEYPPFDKKINIEEKKNDE